MNLFLREFADNRHGGSQNRLQLMNPKKVMDTLTKPLYEIEVKWMTTPLASVRKMVADCMHGPGDHVEGLVDVVCQVLQAPAPVDRIAESLERGSVIMANGVFGNSWASFWVDGTTIAAFLIKGLFKAVVYGWNSLPVALKLSSSAYVVWRLRHLLRSEWTQPRICYDGQDDITFCATCTPELLDPSCMMLGNAYEKKFHVPAKCPRCSWCWQWAGWKNATVRIDNVHYQFLGTYSAMRMQRERDVHCPVANQLDITNEYMFVHRFMQFHAGTIGAMQGRHRWMWSFHTRSYCLATGWKEIQGGDATQYKPRVKPTSTPAAVSAIPGPPPAKSKQIQASPKATLAQPQTPEPVERDGPTAIDPTTLGETETELAVPLMGYERTQGAIPDEIPWREGLRPVWPYTRHYKTEAKYHIDKGWDFGTLNKTYDGVPAEEVRTVKVRLKPPIEGHDGFTQGPWQPGDNIAFWPTRRDFQYTEARGWFYEREVPEEPEVDLFPPAPEIPLLAIVDKQGPKPPPVPQEIQTAGSLLDAKHGYSAQQ